MMKAVKAEVASSKPISLSKASAILSHFTASDTGAQPDVSAYLRRAAAAFEELVAVHREIRHQRKISQVEHNDKKKKEKKKKETGDCEADKHPRNLLFNGVMEGKKVKGRVEEEESGRVGDATESNGVVKNKSVGKRERKEELSEDGTSRKMVEMKKRKHSDSENGRMAWQMEQNEGKKRRI